MLHTYVLITICNVVAFKYCHCCGVNVAAIVCNAAADIMLLSLCAKFTYVLVIRCDFAASKCNHHCGINDAVTVCSAPSYMLLLLYMLHMCQSLYVMLLYSKCHHCCGINVTVTMCSAATAICCCY